MGIAIGLDIGGTKIAGAAFDDAGHDVVKAIVSTPQDYSAFVCAVRDTVDRLGQSPNASIGIGLPFAVANMPFLVGRPLREDLEKLFARPVAIANDANCAALAEAMEGAGKGCASVCGLILGTGVGSGFVINGKVADGANGLAGEIGHLPLPYYEEADGPRVDCGCGQKGCIEKLICGAGLARLYESMTGRQGDAKHIADRAHAGDTEALSVLDRYYTVVAKAMIAILHTFDPDIIVVSGGLNSLPGLYGEVPKRWGRYALAGNPKTKFVAAKFGATAGLRGAAWLGKNS